MILVAPEDKRVTLWPDEYVPVPGVAVGGEIIATVTLIVCEEFSAFGSAIVAVALYIPELKDVGSTINPMFVLDSEERVPDSWSIVSHGSEDVIVQLRVALPISERGTYCSPSFVDVASCGTT